MKIQKGMRVTDVRGFPNDPSSLLVLTDPVRGKTCHYVKVQVRSRIHDGRMVPGKRNVKYLRPLPIMENV